MVTIAVVLAALASTALVMRWYATDRAPAPTVTGAVPAPAAATPSKAAERTEQAVRVVRVVPKPTDFTATVKPLATTCGLSIRPAPEMADQRVAHCKVAYRTTVTYHGSPLPPSAAYVVSYQLVGTVNGSEPYSVTMTGGRVPSAPGADRHPHPRGHPRRDPERRGTAPVIARPIPLRLR